MNINLGNVKASGYTRFVVRNKHGDITQDTGFQNNLLLDRFFTALSFSPLYAKVGTSTASPLVTDTDIGAQLGPVSASGTTTGGGSDVSAGDAINGYTLTTKSYIFRWSLGAIVGNISEYVLCTSTSIADTAIVRNLFKDSGGNPTTLTLTSSDQLEIWWKQSKKWTGSNEMGNTVSNIVLNGIATDITLTQLNPSLLSSVSSFSQNVGPSVIANLTLRTLTDNSNSSALAIYNANAGDDLIGGTFAAEQMSNSTAGTISNPIAGVARITHQATFGLYASGALTALKAIVLSTSFNSLFPPSSVVARLKFNPEFVKGTDKMLTVGFYYDVTRV